jgi:hypothetical protein
MDSKHQENYLKKYDEKSLEKIQSKVIFSDPAYQYIFKKTEKIVAAVYLVTNLISDIEPIKSQIRKVSIGLMSDTLAIKRLPAVSWRQTVSDLIVTVSEIISLLKIASTAEYVSSMNYSILQKELALLIDNFHSLHLETIGNGALVLPQDFFSVPATLPSHFSPTNFPTPQAFSPKGQYRTPNSIKDNSVSQTPKDSLKDTKTNRHDTILQLLKSGKPLGIKDFAREIKGYSEKTLQRELLAMVKQGVLKKIGERRWSHYALA